ncbi:MAG: nucleotidyltransferase family protein [Bacteroidota bacterium]
MMNQGSIHAMILAAGESLRLGSPKQLLLYQGTTLIRHLAKTALDSRAHKVSVVIGANAGEIEAEVSRLPLSVINNAKWQEGISSSIRAAVAALGSDTAAVLFLLSDQPLVSTPILNALIEAFREHPDRIIACAYADTVGVPAIFPKSYFPDLAALTGDAGAKTVLLRNSATVSTIPFPDGAIDIDSLSDLKKLK